MASHKQNATLETRHDHFNEHEFNKIREIATKNPEEAIPLYEKYFERYPEDNSALTYFVSLLTSTGHYDKAKKVLKKIEYQLDNNVLYSTNKTRYEFLQYNIIFCKLKLLMYEKKYKEALELYNRYQIKLDKGMGLEISFYLKKMNGLLDTSKRSFSESYIYRQIRSYSEEDFRDHVKKHEQDYNGNNKFISNAYFAYDFPLDKVIEEVKKYIPSDKKVSYGFFEDNYIFKYTGCGRHDDKLVDYFKVITFRDTKDIITMCPANDCEYLPISADLTLLNEKQEEKVKKLSQIEKFNKRYNR